MTAWANFNVATGGTCTCCNVSTLACCFRVPYGNTAAYANATFANTQMNLHVYDCVVYQQFNQNANRTSINNIDCFLSANRLYLAANITANNNSFAYQYDFFEKIYINGTSCNYNFSLTASNSVSYTSTKPQIDLFYQNFASANSVSMGNTTMTGNVSFSGNLNVPAANYYYAHVLLLFQTGGPQPWNVGLGFDYGPTVERLCTARGEYTSGNTTAFTPPIGCPSCDPNL